MTTVTYDKFALEFGGRTILHGGPLAVDSVEMIGLKPEPLWSGTLEAECEIETTEADRQRMAVPARLVSFLAVDLERLERKEA